MPSSQLGKLGSTVNGAILPMGGDSPLGLYPCDLTLYEEEGAEGEAPARLVLLPAR